MGFPQVDHHDIRTGTTTTGRHKSDRGSRDGAASQLTGSSYTMPRPGMTWH